MPNRSEHCKHCEELYGYDFEEIHKWMDGTVKSRGPSHRVDRHDIDKAPDKAYEIFKDKVPPEYRRYIRDAVKDHIELDKRGEGVPTQPKPESKPIIATVPITIFGLFFLIGIFMYLLDFNFFPPVSGYECGPIVGGLIGGGILGSFLGILCLKSKTLDDAMANFGVSAVVTFFFSLGGFLISSLGLSLLMMLMTFFFLGLTIIAWHQQKEEEKEILERHGSGEEKYYCITCGKKIPEEEYEGNSGECDDCVGKNGAKNILLSLALILFLSAVALPQANAAENRVVKSFESWYDSNTGGLAWSGQNLWQVGRKYLDKIYKIDPQDGDLIKSFDASGQISTGLAWGDQYLWNADYESNKIYKIDPSDGDVVDSFSALHEDPDALVWDGEHLWNGNWASDKIYKINPSTGGVVKSIELPNTLKSSTAEPTGLAWDGAHLWIGDWDSGKIYGIDPSDGDVVRSLSFRRIPPYIQYLEDLAWEGDYLWISTDYDIYKLDCEGYTLTAITSPPEGGSVSLEPPSGLYEGGTTVTVTANPAPGYKLDHWSGDASGSENQITMTVNSNNNLVAHFQKEGLAISQTILTVAMVGFAIILALSISLFFDSKGDKLKRTTRPVAPEGKEIFYCPNCGAYVGGKSDSCPECGLDFT